MQNSGSFQTHGLAYGNASSNVPLKSSTGAPIVSSTFVPSGTVVRQNSLGTGNYNPTVP